MEFQEKLIKLNQAFENKEEAIRYCGRLLVEAGHVNEAYVDAIVQRDADLSVYMGNFIAIPHGTDAAKKEVNSSGVAIVQVPRGVNFGTQENPKVVTVLFGIAGLGDEHLEIIQKISIFCADVDNVVKLADAQSVEEVIRLLNNVE